jgi:hypothetical protein
LANTFNTPSQYSQFTARVTEADYARQLELVETLIKKEQDLHNIRMANLREYHGEFKSLNSSIAQKGSSLSSSLFALDSIATKTKGSEPSGPSGPGGPKKDSSAGKATSNPFQPNRQLAGDEIYLGPTEEEIEKEKEMRQDALKFISDYAKELSKDIDVYEQELLERQARSTQATEERYAALRKRQFDNEALRAESQEKRLLDLGLQRAYAVAEAQNKALEIKKGFEAELSADGELLAAMATNRAAETDAAVEAKLVADLRDRYNQDALKLEYEIRRKNNGELDEEAFQRGLEYLNEEYALKLKNLDKYKEKEYDKDVKNRAKLAAKERASNIDTLLTGKTSDRIEALKKLTQDDDGNFNAQNTLVAAIETSAKLLSDLAKQLEDKIKQIASFQSNIDTRLQGSSNKQFAGSYWQQLTRDMMSVGAVTPFFKQEDFANNIKTLVNQGISFDLKQRAFLMTIQEKIATTFDVADGTLLRLIRLQQEDSTAGRLGMESALTTFLNTMYENTEYLNNVAKSVRSSLEEMEALLSGAQSAEIEYQVQKWMGSLFSVGMSDTAVNSIANAIGLIGSGQLEGITGGGAGNLVIMAASNAGIPIADILTNGLTSEDTNKLLQAMTEYLAKIADSTSDNQVVQQQLANVFGVKASDLRAAASLTTKGSIGSIAGSSYTYSQMLNHLTDMASTMHKRTSMSEMMTNIWENAQYTLASGVANNPVSYLIYKLASLLDDAVGGIDLPFVNVYGFGVDLNTTVSDLMRIASLGTGMLANLGPMISGLANSFSGANMLAKMGIESGSGLAVTPRGTISTISSSMSLNASGRSTSGSGYVGNASGSDIKNTTIQEAEDTKNAEMVEAQEEQENNHIVMISETTLKIYELIQDVTKGKATFKVKVVDYGLTTHGNGSGNPNAGVDGIARLSARAAASAGGYAGSITSNPGAGTDLGGWVTSV